MSIWKIDNQGSCFKLLGPGSLLRLCHADMGGCPHSENKSVALPNV